MVEVKIDCYILQMEERLHKYLFLFGILNNGASALKNVITEVSFPTVYLENKKWSYPHLTSRTEKVEGKDYTVLIFNFDALSEPVKREYEVNLLPSKMLWIFGKPGDGEINRVEYLVDDQNLGEMAQYEIRWKVFIDGALIDESSVPFKSLQKF